MAESKPPRQAVAQTLGPAPAARTHRDWSARTRSSMGDALRYTRFVTIMKRALPLAAGAILAAVIAYSMQPRQQQNKLPFTVQSMGTIDNDLAMIKPRLTGQDAEGNPFVITADAAIQDPTNIRRARLKNLEADMTLKAGRWLNATAQSGLIDTEAHMLWLQGPIALFSDDGNEMHTTAATVNLKTGIIQGDKPITGQGPQGTMRADHFRIQHAMPVSKKPSDRQLIAAARKPSPTRIYLYGNVHMTIDPRAAAGK